MGDFTNIVTNLGFPIACVLACAWYIFTMNKQTREDTNKREELARSDSRNREDRMFSQLDKFGDSLDKFNSTLMQIDARLGSLEKKVDAKIVED